MCYRCDGSGLWLGIAPCDVYSFYKEREKNDRERCPRCLGSGEIRKVRFANGNPFAYARQFVNEEDGEFVHRFTCPECDGSRKRSNL